MNSGWQVVPNENSEPSEVTDVRILHDESTIYVGIRCFERDPSTITAMQMRHDGDMRGDDRVGVMLDTNLDRRSGYYFDINPVGAAGDLAGIGRL